MLYRPFFTVQGGLCPGGRDLCPGGGISVQDVGSLSRGVSVWETPHGQRPPPPCDRMTDTSKNITLP